MKYINDLELQQLAETGLTLRRKNGLWVCDQGAVALPIHFSLTVSDVRIQYDETWCVFFSFAGDEEFLVKSMSFVALNSALYDIGAVMAAWVEDTHTLRGINPSNWDIVREVIAFIAANADNNDPLPDQLYTAIKEQETPALFYALYKVQAWRAEVE